MPGPVAQLVTSQIADPGVTSLIPSWPPTFVEIYHEIFFMVILRGVKFHSTARIGELTSGSAE